MKISEEQFKTLEEVGKKFVDKLEHIVSYEISRHD